MLELSAMVYVEPAPYEYAKQGTALKLHCYVVVVGRPPVTDPPDF